MECEKALKNKADKGSTPKSQTVVKGLRVLILPGESSPHPRVVESLDVFEHISPGGIECRIRHAVDPLALEQPEEAFARSVVTAVAHRTHRTHQSVGRQITLVVAAPELAATVRMKDHGMTALALPDGHLDGPDHHLPVLPVVHRPTHDPLVEQVQHDAQVQLALPGLEFGDVGDPLGLRLQRSEVPFQQVAHARRRQRRATALAVTGQLEAETYALAYKRVYTFGPTFRAENSNTKTHAAEFWMIEPEICFCDLNGLMDIEEDFLKSVVQEVLDKAMPELEFLQGYAKSNLIEKLQTLTQSHVARVTHAEAIDILQHATHPFEHPAVQGEDLFKEHEKYLTEEHFKSPVFVYDWPKEIKAFYMYQNDDGKTVRGVDLLVPGSGELMGGSERETRLDLLTGRMDELHISKEQMDWYVNLRRFGGCTHSGFGMGFERLIMYLTDIENIRDVIPYPRTPGNCEF